MRPSSLLKSGCLDESNVVFSHCQMLSVCSDYLYQAGKYCKSVITCFILYTNSNRMIIDSVCWGPDASQVLFPSGFIISLTSCTVFFYLNCFLQHLTECNKHIYKCRVCFLTCLWSNRSMLALAPQAWQDSTMQSELMPNTEQESPHEPSDTTITRGHSLCGIRCRYSSVN